MPEDFRTMLLSQKLLAPRAFLPGKGEGSSPVVMFPSQVSSSACLMVLANGQRKVRGGQDRFTGTCHKAEGAQTPSAAAAAAEFTQITKRLSLAETV